MKESEVSHQSLLCPHLMDLFSSSGERLEQSHVLNTKALLSENEPKLQNFYPLLSSFREESES